MSVFHLHSILKGNTADISIFAAYAEICEIVKASEILRNKEHWKGH